MMSVGVAAAQIGQGQTTTPQSAVNPDDPVVRNPQSPTSSNRGDPGSEAVNPKTGGPALGQGEGATVGSGTSKSQERQKTERSNLPPAQSK